ncbi:MAG TPA: hypothetical protein VFH73_13310 [Polyangia bacterium]|nr:hypothetical protein [Polyangia bacterium]
MLAALALGCARSVPATPGPADARLAARPAADASAPSGQPALVKIAAFDCEKYEVFPNEAPPKGLIAPGASIRAWKGGGPYGANWNVEELRCVARASTPCVEGKVLFTLRVGQHVVAERETAVSKGAAEFEVVLPSPIWERGYDSPPKAEALKLPFKTAGFRVQVALDCEAPTKASLRDWNYRFVVADEAFVAGFASGE